LIVKDPNILPVKEFDFNILRTENREYEYCVIMKMQRMTGTLNDKIDECKKQKRFIPEDTVLKYFYGIAYGLQYLHKKNVAHRDIKPANILLDHNDAI